MKKSCITANNEQSSKYSGSRGYINDSAVVLILSGEVFRVNQVIKVIRLKSIICCIDWSEHLKEYISIVCYSDCAEHVKEHSGHTMMLSIGAVTLALMRLAMAEMPRPGCTGCTTGCTGT